MKKIVELLQNLGFTQYESQVYLALLRQSNVSGYELARQSGVPASKIYPTLNKLLDKNVIQVIDTEPSRYIPHPPAELLNRMRGEYLQTIGELDTRLEQIYSSDEMVKNQIWTLNTHQSILLKVRQMLTEAQTKIYLSVWDEEVGEIQDLLLEAHNRNLIIYIVHFGSSHLNIGTEYHHGQEHQIRIQRGGRRLAMMVDDQKVILGHFLEDGVCDAVWTTNKGLVLLAKDYIIHDIYSLRVIERYGEEARSIFEF